MLFGADCRKQSRTENTKETERKHGAGIKVEGTDRTGNKVNGMARKWN
jgi:hypothetical protein